MKISNLKCHLTTWSTRKYEIGEKQKNNNENKDNGQYSPYLKQCFAASGPLLLTIGVGLTMGYSAILLPQLQLGNEISKITANSSQQSWIASLAALPMAIGTLIGGYLIEKFGRKTTHIITCLPTLLGWCVIGFAANIHMIILGRFITGLCSGILAPATGVYIAEMTEPKLRGFLLGAISLSVALGLLLSHLIGTFLYWQTTALTFNVIPIGSWILFYFAPKSPSWLARTGQTKAAQDSFYWLRHHTEESQKELEDMLAKQQTTCERTFKENLQGFTEKECLKPMIIVSVFFIICQWSGPNAISFYSVSIMKETIQGGVDEYFATILLDVVRVVASIGACILLKRFGRRPLAIGSGIGTFFSLFTLSAFAFISKMYLQNTSKYSFIPVVSLIVYISFISVGFIALPWTLVGELLPLSGRSFSSGAISCVAFVATFGVVKTSPELFERIGPEGTFLLYGIVAFLGTIFVLLCLPETKGKTLQEIEDKFKGESSLGSNIADGSV